MGMSGNTQNQITEGNIFRQLLFFFFPILFGTFFQQLYNTADAIVVGQFVGKEALAAVGGGVSVLINLLVGFFVGLASGATVIIAQFYGGRKADKVHWAVHTSIAFSLIGGICMMLMGIAGSKWALRAMSTPEDVIAPSLIYLNIYFLGTIPNLIYNMGTGILRAAGDSRRPLYYLIAGCFTNIILDILLVAVFNFGVAGAAFATIVSQLLSAVLVVLSLMRTNDIFKLSWQQVKIDTRMLKRIVQLGVPAGMQSIMYSFSNIIVQAGINTLGTDNATAWAAYGKVDGLFWMTINAFGIAVTTFAGQNYGAGRIDRVRKGTGACMIIAVVMTITAGAGLYHYGHHLVRLFTTDIPVQAITMELLHFMVPTFITYITIEILSGTLRGVGDAWVPLVITGIGVCLVRIFWILFVLPHFSSIIGAAFCYPLTWSLTSLAFVVYYYFFSTLRRWRLNRY